jgi:ribosomal protein S6--L-glutamate ligase
MPPVVATTTAMPPTDVERSALSLGPFAGDQIAHGAPDPEASRATVDAVVVRTMPPGSLEQVVFRMDVLGRLESQGVPVVNRPKALECAVDKYLTTARLAAAGLPVPRTHVCETTEQALHGFGQLGRDVVAKPLFGAEGRGIVRLTDPETAARVFRAWERIGAVIYQQPFLDHGGRDLRILVLGGRVLGGMYRYATQDFRTNVSQAGQAEAANPSDAEGELALRAASATGAEFAGIDLLTDRCGQTYVIEVNAVPGWKAFAAVNHSDPADLFWQWLELGRSWS